MPEPLKKRMESHAQQEVHVEFDSDSDDDVPLPGLILSALDDSSVESDDDSVPDLQDAAESSDEEDSVGKGPRWIPDKSPRSDQGEVHMVHVISTVEELHHGLTERQYKRAVRARRLYHQLGRPTVENFKHILKANMIKDCPVAQLQTTMSSWPRCYSDLMPEH